MQQKQSSTVIIVGAGLSGICMAIALKKQGIDFLIFEKSGEVGGTWSKNIYPGSGCDIPMFAYCYSFEVFKGDAWPKQPAILEYFKHCVEKYEIASHLLLGSDVEEARFDSVQGLWEIQLANGGNFFSRFLINGTGQLNQPRWPTISGLREMGIPVVHSAEFPKDFDCCDKTIAIVGNGASALQIVEALQPQVKDLLVFSQSPKYIFPRVEYSPATTKRLESDAEFWKNVRDMFVDSQDKYRLLLDNFPQLDPFDENSGFASFYAQSEGVDLQEFKDFYQWLTDQELRPNYPTGCSRPLVSKSFQNAFRADNVTLIRDPLRGAHSRSIFTDKCEYPIDMVICATGFDLNNLIPPYRIIGKDQRTLENSWVDSPSTYLGLATTNFPNLFFLYGPNTNTNASSVTFFIESQVNYIAQILALDSKTNIHSIEAKPGSVSRFQDLLLSRSVSERAVCSSWYKNANNQNISTFPGGFREYAQLTLDFNAEDFDIKYAAQQQHVVMEKSVNEHEIQRGLINLISAVTMLPVTQITLADGLRDYHMDSILIVDFIRRVNSRWNLKLEPVSFFEFISLRDFSNHIVELTITSSVSKSQVSAPEINETQLNTSTEVTAFQAETSSIFSAGPTEFKDKISDEQIKLWQTHNSKPALHPERSESAGFEPIAIIGMQGYLPGASDLDDFWRNLIANYDAISEIPSERWSWQSVYGDPADGDRTKVKWGAFLSRVDGFDPLFFKMSPKEAELMDPQHRLFLMCAWELLESAGYNPLALSGRNIGVMLGINLNDYADRLSEKLPQFDVLQMSGLMHLFAPNRLSYLLGFTGPSSVVDTACSSSLIAIHRAIQAIHLDKCEMVIAGGSNLILTPKMHLLYSKAGMLAEDGHCKTFSAQANGYVRGEGVGAVLLKKLSAAERDGDTILGVIRGSAENHGGKANSLTSPNSRAQSDLIVEAMSSAKIDPRSVGYIECHGTGTALGDPIEINGIKKAYERLYQQAGLAPVQQAHCGLGSLKSNIGHLETAAGVASIIKVLLAMKHRTLPATLNATPRNPQIHLENSPFYVADENRPWQAVEIDGQLAPVRAGISSFGAGGSNAHIVLEAYQYPQNNQQDVTAALIPLSARTEAQLKQMVVNLAASLEFQLAEQDTNSCAPLTLGSVAYTLQTGRQAMEERLCLVIYSLDDLLQNLRALANSTSTSDDVLTGRVEAYPGIPEAFLDETDWQNAVSNMIAKGRFDKVAQLWVKGYSINWQELYKGQTPRRVCLPTYPFELQRCWVDDEYPATQTATKGFHPLLHTNVSSFYEQGYQSRYRGDEFFLSDHQVAGFGEGANLVKVLPAVAYLEMARAGASVAFAGDKAASAFEVKDVVWAAPVIVDGEFDLFMRFKPDDEGDVQFEFVSATVESDAADGEMTLHCQGRITPAQQNAPAPVSIENIRARMIAAQFDKAKLYQSFTSLGLHYGVAHQSVTKLHVGSQEVLAALSLPSSLEKSFGQYELHPSLLDGALQATIGLAVDFNDPTQCPRLPFALDSLCIYERCSKDMYAWVRSSTEQLTDSRFQKYDIDLLDINGRLCVRLIGLTTRLLEGATSPAKTTNAIQPGMNYLAPVFSSVIPLNLQISAAQVLVVCLKDDAAWVRESLPEANILIQTGSQSADILATSIKSAGFQHVLWVAPDATVDTGKEPLANVIGAFRLVRALISAGKDAENVQLTLVTRAIYPVHPESDCRPASAGVPGLAGSLANELPDWQVNVIDIDAKSFITAHDCLANRAPRKAQALIHRSGEWFIHELAHVKYLPVRTQAMGRQGGVYVVVGGAGGVGELWSHYMITNYDAQVIWIGRRPQDATIEAKLDDLSRLGRRPLYISADATDEHALTQAFATIKLSYPKIHGVVHSALVLDDSGLANMSEERFATVFAAKAAISINLDRIFSTDSDAGLGTDLDFMLFFSSLNSFTHGAGQANYSAGCTFSDAYARYLDGQRKYPVKVVNWGFWGSVGVVADDFYKARMARAGFDSIESEAGFEALEQLLLSPAQQLAVANFLNAQTVESLVGPVDRYYLNGALGNRDEHYSSLKDTAVLSAIDAIESSKTSQALPLLAEVTESLAAEWVARALLEAGMLGDSSTLNTTNSGAGFYARWLESSLDYLSNQGWLDKSGKLLRSVRTREQLQEIWSEHKRIACAHPDRQGRVELLETCLKNLPEILAGKRPATDVMFPDSSLALVEKVYHGNDIADGFNEILAATLVQFIQALQAEAPTRPIRILEVGAGTGGTTKIVLPYLKQLSAPIAEYCYTDLSRAFLLHAEEQFKPDFPALRTVILDGSKSISAQGFTPGEYDFVLATNVLHATPNIRITLQNAKALLKPQGVLLLNELSDWSWFYHLTFGLLEGWWLYEDSALRLPGTPALAPEQWREVLTGEGFSSLVMPQPGARHLGQFVIAAASDGIVQQLRDSASVSTSVSRKESVPSKVARTSASQMSGPISASISDDLQGAATQYFRKLIAETLKLPLQKVDPKKSFSEYGLDSILVVQLTNKLKKTFSDIPATLFFEVSTLNGLVAHFIETRASELANVVQQTSVQITPAQVVPGAMYTNNFPVSKKEVFGQRKAVNSNETAVAIIGLSGRYPMANDMSAFWENLAEGKNCSSEIPADRWNWADYFEENTETSGKMYTKWGGFVKDVDKFDPLFFRISPREAIKMDPQERIFLEASYHAIEDAGYTPSSLDESKKVGVYAGVMNSRYSAQPQYFSIANRVSYVFDFRGPSMAIDTACSSSLTAVHLATEAIQNGSCEIAIAGGVNVIVDPVHFLTLTDLHMLSNGDSCKSFGVNADGFVDAEGVGAVVLKPLWKAERDGDQIYGVLLGSAVNAGGKTNGYTVPNPVAQAALVTSAMAKAGVSSDQLSYLEAHGTGTALGDPIEVAGLTAAFKGAIRSTGFCAIGSLKSNIGHCESAAGVAGLTKILLQLKHQMLVPSINAEQINPEINFAKTPFRLQTRLEQWHRPILTDKGAVQELPRMAGVSSFGAGGANAHIIVREHLASAAIPALTSEPVLVPLSARTQQQLQQKAGQLLEFIRSTKSINLNNLAFTLQVGREALDFRLAMVVTSADELSEKLSAFLKSGQFAGGFTGSVRDADTPDLQDESEQTKALNKWLGESQLEKLAQAWAKGSEIDWSRLQRSIQPRRMSLPLYPFARDRFWLSADQRRVSLEEVLPTASLGETRLHPLVHRSTAKFGELSYLSNLSGNQPDFEYWRGLEQVPAFLLTEMVIAATRLSLTEVDNTTYIQLDQLFWGPAVSWDKATDIQVLFEAIADDQALFDVCSGSGDSEQVILQGRVLWQAKPQASTDSINDKSFRIEFPSTLNIDNDWQIREFLLNELLNHGFNVPSEILLPASASAIDAILPLGEGPFQCEYTIRNGGQALSANIFNRSGNCVLIVRDLQRVVQSSEKATLFAPQVLTIPGEQSDKPTGIRLLAASDILDISVDATTSTFTRHSAIADLQPAAAVAETWVARTSNKGVVSNPASELKIADARVPAVAHSTAQIAGSVEDAQTFLRKSLADSLYMNLDDVDVDTSYVDLGLDSIVAVEWIRAVNKHYSQKLSATVVYSYPTIREFANYLASGTRGASKNLVANDLVEVETALIAKAAIPVEEVTAPAAKATQIAKVSLALGDIEKILAETLADSLYMNLSDVEIDKPFVDLGLDSIVAVEWIKLLNKRFNLSLNATRVYDYPDVRQLSAFLQSLIPVAIQEPIAQEQVSRETQSTAYEPGSPVRHSVGNALLKGVTLAHLKRRIFPRTHANTSLTKVAVEEKVSIAEKVATEEKIAIIGMSGRYPMAENLSQYWQNLSEGRDCVTEIPATRWDAQSLYDPHMSRPGTINSKWLGALDDADCFDPLFFQISPADAENMDPQHRLFLQESYRAFEDAGYSNSRLSNLRCGVYMGIMSTEYYLLQGQSNSQNFDVTANSFAIGAARTAYHLNLKGPAIPVDTACSSSLVAAHLAVQALRNGEIDMALAGGVSLYLAPETYLAMCQAGMLSTDGRCKAFDNQANGFVPAEGVGTLVLKRLSDAERDGDPIHAVIIGSGINQDGKTNGITAPSVISQIELERDVYRRFGIDPQTISYVEAHGTGTKLGDPIELEALATVFSESTSRKNFCGIGSVKSNLGHTSGAAGVASVQKVVLSMQNETLVPSLHVQEENSHFNFANSPFFITRDKQPWSFPGSQLRRAAVSSFGYSGTNAHLVLEEYRPAPIASSAQLPDTSPAGVILLSARTAVQLQQRAKDLLTHLIARESNIDLAALAYTLQTGREPMRERLGLIVNSSEMLIARLRAYIAGTTHPDTGIFVSADVRDKDTVALFTSDPDLRDTLDKWIERRQFARVVELWVKGLDIDWAKAYGENTPKRVHLPTYPFAKERYWIDTTSAQRSVTQSAVLHPLVHQNHSDFYQQKYRTKLHPQDALLRDHVIGGRSMLAGSVQIEMACAAVRDAWQLERNTGLVVQDIRWLNVFVAGEGDSPSLQILLTPDVDDQWAQFEIVTGEENPVVHSCGFVTRANTNLTTVLDLAAIQARCKGEMLDKQTIYQRFNDLGMSYGPSLRSVSALHLGIDEVLARLIAPDEAQDFDDYAMHPSMLEGALHAVFGFRFWQEGAEMPVAIEELQLLEPVPAKAWAWLKRKERSYEVRICDDAGRVCLMVTGFSTCGIESAQPAVPATILFEPGWRQLPETSPQAIKPQHTTLLILGCEALERELKTQIDDCLSEPVGDTNSRVRRYGLRALETIQKVAGLQHAGTSLIRVVYPADETISLTEPLCALFETAHLENSRIYTQLIPISPAMAAEELLSQLSALEDQVLAPLTRCEANIQSQRSVQEIIAPEQSPDIWRSEGVYLITGGLGGLGALFANWAAQNAMVPRLILTGRSSLTEAKQRQLGEWRKRGVIVEYHQVDVADRAKMQSLVNDVVERFGRINGVLHSAGIVADERIAVKTKDVFTRVVAPKIDGALALDEATRHLELDFFVLFSSFAGYRGNSGQCDYAFANGFLDAFSQWRQAEVEKRNRRGRTLSINWPLWLEGGMQVDAATLNHLKASTGMQPLPSEEGLSLLAKLVAANKSQVLVAHGEVARVNSYFQKSTRSSVAFQHDSIDHVEPASASKVLPQGALQNELLGLVAKQLKIRLDDLDTETKLSDYGFDSISFTEFANRINERFDVAVAPTIFFEYPTLASFAHHLEGEFPVQLSAVLGEAVTEQARDSDETLLSTQAKIHPEISSRSRSRFKAVANQSTPTAPFAAEPLAIVGISGRFPQADTLEAFWQNLVEGRDCIEEIPATRWDWREWFGDPRTDRNRTNIRFGAFISGVDEFDPLFFGISPREALQMDPQQRLLMTYVWKAIEDAGYAPGNLAGSKTGIFIGSANTGYSDLLAQANTDIEGFSPTGSVPSVGPNRMSFLLDLNGPSEVIETACSSSLVALHRAVQAIEAGDCEMAIVGGVNTIVTPWNHIAFSKAGMLSEDGRCKTFSNEANGYVRGEGVGMLFVKKLSAAERDGDSIYGLVKGTAENHGGRANSLTAPNPLAQAKLLVSAYEKARIDPRTLGYIEAHGTGTALGDPVEINALKAAFRDLYATTSQSGAEGNDPDVAHCGLGSVKSNIGHLELAAGVAGVIKVLLQFRHQQRVKSLHCESLNPYIDLSDSPFFIQQRSDEWPAVKDSTGQPLPRRAGVSSFGFGGVNAHVVLEEYIPKASPQAKSANPSSSAVAIVLSAKTRESLVRMAVELLGFVEKLPAHAESVSRLTNLAFTLQVGRDEMEERLAFVATSETELQDKLRAFLDDRLREFTIFSGRVSRNSENLSAFADDEDFDVAIDNWIEKGRLDRLLGLWVQGLSVNWQRLYRDSLPARMHLPGYAFAREKFWIEQPGNNSVKVDVKTARLHPLLHANCSDLTQQCFSAHFDGKETFLEDHQVRLSDGAHHKILPAVAYLEMARAAVQHSLPRFDSDTPMKISHATWIRPCVVDQPQDLSILVSEVEDSGEIDIKILSENSSASNELLCRMQVSLGNPLITDVVDLEALKAQLTGEYLKGSSIYTRLAELGLNFGPTHRALQNLQFNDHELLAEIRLPESAVNSHFVLHPSLLDAALQASVGLLDMADGNLAAAPLPFALESFEVFAPLPSSLYAWVRRASSSRAQKNNLNIEKSDGLHLDIDLLDETGRLCVRLGRFTYRMTVNSQQIIVQGEKSNEVIQVHKNSLHDESLYLDITSRLLTNEITVEEALELGEQA